MYALWPLRTVDLRYARCHYMSQAGARALAARYERSIEA